MLVTLNGYPVNSKTQPRDKSDVITNRYGVFSDGVMTDIARVLCQAGFAVTNGSALACYISKCDLKGGRRHPAAEADFFLRRRRRGRGMASPRLAFTACLTKDLASTAATADGCCQQSVRRFVVRTRNGSSGRSAHQLPIQQTSMIKTV